MPGCNNTYQPQWRAGYAIIGTPVVHKRHAILEGGHLPP
jgi:hypothetical protein